MKFKIFLVGLILASVFFISTTALAMTEQERQTLIAQIQAQIAQLTQQLNQMIAEQQGTETWCHTFNIDLDTGDTGSEVTFLQTAFQKEGFIISASEIQNQQFGATTGQAVQDFKVKYSSQIVTSGTTKVADRTRGMLNQLYGCTTQPACTPYWYCGSWSACTDSQQTRSCSDANYCGVTTGAPSQTQFCTSACTPDWQCGSWSSCLNSQQTKTCTDSNNCGTTTGKPETTQSCGSNISNNTCTDTDGSQKTSGNVSFTLPGVTYTQWGNNYYTKGTTTGVYNEWNSSNTKSGVYGSYTDYCSGNKLMEYYCYASPGYDEIVANFVDSSLAGYQNGGAPARAYYSTECNLGCQDGACKTGIFVSGTFGATGSGPIISVTTGSTHSIFWGFEGTTPGNVNINLADDLTGKVYPITTNTPTPANGGGYSWIVPQSMPAGSKYKFSVESGATKGISSYFSIVSNRVCYYNNGGVTVGDSNIGGNYLFYKDGDECVPSYQSSSQYLTAIKLSKKYSCSSDGSLVTTTTSFSCSSNCGVCIPCVSNWQCTAWSSQCSDPQQTGIGIQTRSCADSNNCMTTTKKPSTSRSCTTCTANWSCSPWSACTTNGQQTRTCSDLNNCFGTCNTYSCSIISRPQPATTQSCGAVCTPNLQCGNWSICANSLRTKTCTDLNNCGVANSSAQSEICSFVLKANEKEGENTVPYNGSVILSWEISNEISYCWWGVDQPVGAAIIQGSGSLIVNNLTSSKNYVMTCVYKGGADDSSIKLCADNIYKICLPSIGCSYESWDDAYKACRSAYGSSDVGSAITKYVKINVGSTSLLDALQNQVASIADAVAKLMAQMTNK